MGSPNKVTCVFWVGTKGFVLVGACHNCIFRQRLNSIQLILEQVEKDNEKAVDDLFLTEKLFDTIFYALPSFLLGDSKVLPRCASNIASFHKQEVYITCHTSN